MDTNRELALKLAHEAACRYDMSTADTVLDRARAYLDFLNGDAAFGMRAAMIRVQAAQEEAIKSSQAGQSQGDWTR